MRPVLYPPYKVLKELHTYHVGPNGNPTLHERITQIVAITTVAEVPCRYRESDVFTLKSIGRVGKSYPLAPGGVTGVNIQFDTPLQPGDERSIHVLTRFNTVQPAPCFQVPVGKDGMGALRAFILFARIPQRVWWAQWRTASLDAPVTRESPVSFAQQDGYWVARVEKTNVTQGVYGFRWEL